VWSERQTLRTPGWSFDTLSDDHTLLHLLASICADLRRGACRAKQFLDLYLALRRFGPDLDWEGFFARRAAQGLERVAVNALALFATLWDAADELPELAEALDRRLALVELRGAHEALAIATRPRRSRANRLWFVRLRPGGARLAHLALRASLDLPRVLRGPPPAPWRRGPAPPQADAGPLPAPLRTLLARHGLAAAHAEQITMLPGRAARPCCYRIDLVDGRTVKGRVLRTSAVAVRMRTWIPQLPAGRFPALLATHGVASLEAWAEGSACEASDAQTAEEAGELLGCVHATLAREGVGAADPACERWQHEAELHVDALRETGRLEAARAEELRARLRAGRARAASLGLRHGDFCVENLLRTGAGLCCIDNPTVRPGLLESDLAQTFRRWPMAPAQRERFLSGYRRHADPGLFLAHEDYWMISTALRSAAHRQRNRTAAVDEPLRLLERGVA
jgi:hypothetical protein